MAEHSEMGIMEAIEASKQMMDGNKWSLFCLDFSFIGWMILSACTFGIGDLFLNPYTHMATAHFYLNLSRGSWKLQFGWNDVKGKNLSLNSYKNVKNLRMDFN